MAIDDNASYELTGYQVKDLAQKIRGKADDDVFVGAGSAVAGSRGLVPAPVAGDNTKFLSGDGTWKTVSGGGEVVHEIYLQGMTGFDQCPMPFSNGNSPTTIWDTDGQVTSDKLAVWTVRGERIVLMPEPTSQSYGLVKPIEVISDTIVSDYFDPDTPDTSSIRFSGLHFTVAYGGETSTIPRQATEYTVFLTQEYPSMDYFETTVYQGNTLPLIIKHDQQSIFQWPSIGNDTGVVQCALVGDLTIIQDAFSNAQSTLFSTDILSRIISALFTGRTITLFVISGFSNMSTTPIATITFGSFAFIRSSSIEIPSSDDVYTIIQEILSGNIDLYLSGTVVDYARSRLMSLQFANGNILIQTT